ncbi:MAG: hypothetical protein SPF94_07440 [Desulfovibrio sp.]|nr:hypothetical protein [Desulfovibrio sp.]
MPDTDYRQVVLSVEGIQAYLFSTGKLREMIGASEVTASYPQKFLDFCADQGLHEVREPQSKTSDWYVLLQKGAGKVRVLVPNAGVASALLTLMGLWQIENYPGLPLYGTHTPCQWTIEGLNQAYRDASEIIALKRATQAQPPHAVWPFCRLAPLDGLPAVTKDRDEYISAVSQSRRKKELLTRAANGFKQLVSEELTSLLPNSEICGAEDMDEMVADAPVQKIALLHMDGNDLGRMFKNARDTEQKRSCADYVKAMLNLSGIVDESNKAAFARAMYTIVDKDLHARKKNPASYVVPARPLVLGGDDLTVIVRADLAFAFADTYASTFEKETSQRGKPMSVGGGMVVMPSGYPFTRAYALAEELTDSAKKLTAQQIPRPSSLDYVIITNDMDRNLSALRGFSYQTQDKKACLTGKPFICGTPATHSSPTVGAQTPYQQDACLANVMKDALWLHDNIAHSQLRPSIDACRRGTGEAQSAYDKLNENLSRNLGGSDKNLDSFKRIFPHSFFIKGNRDKPYTLLGDYIELGQLLAKKK